ncbi:MAG TPA: ATP synthase F1 subunit delta [Ktedonobacterales bacterium]|jgi:F-type H+-transporting ATPase subunit delta
MLKGAVARRYAEAVFDLGVQQGTLDRWQSDLHLIAEAYSNRKLAFILRQPRIPFARKEAIVRDLLEKRVTPQAFALASLLVERELVELGPKVAEAFDQQLNDYHNRATAIVTSAVPLAASQQAEVADYLQALTGKTISLETRVDPAILGGITAQIGDTLIDGSVRRRLALLRDQIIRGGTGGPDDGAVAATLGNGHGPDSPAAPAKPSAPAGKANGQSSSDQASPGKRAGNKSGNGNRPKR